MAGRSLADLDVEERVPEHTSVKEVVLPFDRLPGSDPRLGPEMKSTGEVMGTARSFGKAYDKAQDAAGSSLPESGTAVVGFADEDLRESFAAHYDLATFADDDALAEAIRTGAVDLLVTNERDPLALAVEEEVPYVSTRASARAALEALAAKDDPLDVLPVDERPTVAREWGGE
jgi:carbamoyl-phosphate synthase large subunit